MRLMQPTTTISPEVTYFNPKPKQEDCWQKRDRWRDGSGGGALDYSSGASRGGLPRGTIRRGGTWNTNDKPIRLRCRNSEGPARGEAKRESNSAQNTGLRRYTLLFEVSFGLDRSGPLSMEAGSRNCTETPASS